MKSLASKVLPWFSTRLWSSIKLKNLHIELLDRGANKNGVEQLGWFHCKKFDQFKFYMYLEITRIFVTFSGPTTELEGTPLDNVLPCREEINP